MLSNPVSRPPPLQAALGLSLRDFLARVTTRVLFVSDHRNLLSLWCHNPGQCWHSRWDQSRKNIFLTS